MQRKFILIFIFIIITSLLSCISTQYIEITEEELPPVDAGTEINVLAATPDQTYQRIGVARIRGGNSDKRLEKAKSVARKKGGNAVMPREVGILADPNTDEVVDKIGASTYETQEFLIINVPEPEDASQIVQSDIPDTNVEEPAIVTAPVPDASPADDYNSLPRATYKQLVTEYKTLNGEKFKGALLPKKIYKIPASLKDVTDDSDRLILLSTRSGKSRIYLIVDKESIPEVRDKILAGEVLNFVYTPVNVYKTKKNQYPVIKFLDEITE